MAKEEFEYLKKFLIYLGGVLGTVILLFIGTIGWYINTQKNTVDKMYDVVIDNRVNGLIRQTRLDVTELNVDKLKEGYINQDGRMIKLEEADRRFEETLKRNNIN